MALINKLGNTCKLFSNKVLLAECDTQTREVKLAGAWNESPENIRAVLQFLKQFGFCSDIDKIASLYGGNV